MRILALLIGMFLPLAVTAVEFDVWQVPWPKTGPRDPFVAPDGKVWFVGQRGDYAAYLDARNDNFIRYELEPGTGPHNLIVANDGNVFYAGNRSAHIGLLSPATGKIRKIAMPDELQDPHTMVFDSHGNIFFTAQLSNAIGYFDRDSGDIKSWAVVTPRTRPYGIKLNSKDQPWVVLLGSNRLATIENNLLREVELPRPKARPRRLEITTDGRVWYVDYAEGFIGVYDPAAKTFTEWPAPSAKESRPYGTALDADEIFWFVETGPQPNRFIGFDTQSEKIIFNETIPESGGAVRHMYYDAEKNAIWFGMDTNFIGRARLD